MVKHYFFCTPQYVVEFKASEKELRKLKFHVASSIVLTIPIIFLSLPHMFPMQFDNLFPKGIMYNSNYFILALAILIQFWMGWRFYRGFGIE